MHKEVSLLYSRVRLLARGLNLFAAKRGTLSTILLSVLLATTVSASSVTYTYDELGRLKLVTYDNGSTITYTLDAAGNRTSVVQSLDTTPPTVPTGLAATAVSQSQINLSWVASTDGTGATIAGYRVYRAGTQVGTTTSATTTYSDTGLTAFTTYSYTVAAYDNATPVNVSAQSTAASATTLDQTAPSVPSALTATAISGTQINLSWTGSTDPTPGAGLAGYRVYRNGTQVGTTTSTVTTYSDTGLTGFTTYSYTVAAYDGATPVNVSAQSTAASAKTLDQTAPSVPTGLSATAISSTQINLSWSASTDSGSGIGGYRVYRGGTQIGTTTSAVTTYSDTGLTSFTAYSYTVAAFDNATPTPNVSAQSTAASTTTLDQTPPSVPTGLSATAASQTQINLSWTASTDSGSGVGGYRVYRNGTQVGTTASSVTTYSDTGLSGFTAYSYTVAAVDNATPTPNVSAQSTAAGATTPDQTAPSTPSGLTATAASQSQINLSWSASTDTGGSGLGGYRVYRNGTQVGTTTSAVTTYSDTGLAGFTAYSYTVAAVDNATPTPNVSAQSAAAGTTTPDQTAPSVPTGLTATAASQSQINLSWSASTDTGGSGLGGYRVYRNGTQVGTTTSAVTTYSDTALTMYTSYSYTVAAIDNASPVNVSAQSSASSARTLDQTPPVLQAPLSATAASATEIDLIWTKSTGDPTPGAGFAGYTLYRNGVAITGLLPIATVTFSDTGLAPATTYNYTLTATDLASPPNSASITGSATTPSNIPNTPPGTPSPNGIVTSAPWTMTWSASSGPVSYYVVSRTGGTGPTTFNVNAPATSLSGQTGTNGVTYQYQVKACNSSNQCSAYGAVATVTRCNNGVCP